MGIEALAAGVSVLKDVVKLYQDLNPVGPGQVNVLNATSQKITVRSYNSNDWAKLIAAGQITLNPGANAGITAGTDTVVLIWRRGDWGAMDAFGTDHLSQSSVPKDPDKVFVITDKNTVERPNEAARPT